MYSFSLGVGFLPKGRQLWPVSLGVCFSYQGSIYDFLLLFFFGGGESILKNIFEPRSGENKIF